MSKYGARLAQHTVEIPITDLSGVYNLPDDTIIRDCHVLGVYVTANPDDDKHAPGGQTLISSKAMEQAYLTLKCNNLIVWNNVPFLYLQLHPTDRSIGAIDITGFTPNQSFVRIADTTQITVGQRIIIHFLFEDRK